MGGVQKGCFGAENSYIFPYPCLLWVKKVKSLAAKRKACKLDLENFLPSYINIRSG